MVFSEEGEIAGEQRTEEYRPRRGYFKDASDALQNSIKDFLGRPVLIGKFDWLAAGGDLTELVSIHAPRDWFKLQMIQEKLSGFRFLRCDLVFRVQINAQPFNAGRLLLLFKPIWSQMAITPTNEFSFQGLTGYRRADLDLATETAVEIRIPFQGILSHFDLINTNGTMGQLSCIVYSPLTGSSDVDGTVWCWAENISLELPTGVPLVFESGKAQAGQPVKKNPAPQKQERKAGDLERLFDAAGNLLRKGKNIPVLGPFIEAASWVTDIGKGFAALFGFSKPSASKFPTAVQPIYGRYLANYAGDVQEKSLALDARNATDIPVDTFGTEDDEMAISNIVNKPVFMDFFTMDKTQAQDALLWKWPVSPDSCKRVPVAGMPPQTGIIAQNTYLSYLSNMFRFWRGEICYKLRIVKTPFHSGRIRVTVVPGASWDTDFATVDINKNYSAIYDLRETNEVEICVPYKWKAPWKSLPVAINGVNPSRPSYNIPPSMIYITVVNSLRNPTTAADKIEFLVETYAGSDFQFAYPGVWSKFKAVGNSMLLEGISPVGQGLYETGCPQSGDILPGPKMSEFEPNALAIGEAVTSCRQLLKRAIPWRTTMSAGTSVFPYEFQDGSVGAVSLWDPAFLNLNQDFFTLFQFLYRYMSGSMRVTIVDDESHVNTFTIIPQSSNIIPSVDYLTGPNQIQVTALEKIVDLHVPFYQQWPAIPTAVGFPNITTQELPATGLYTSLPFNRGTALVSATAITGQIFRSIGEDFSFGYLIGPPVTFVDTTPS